MAVTDFSGLTINAPQVGIQISKVTDSSADWASVSNSTYFYDKADKLVHYKDSAGNIQEIFSGSGVTVGTTSVTSGTDGRVFFQAGGVIQQDANFTFDNTLKRLTLKAVGTAATDIPFAVQNSAGTRDILQVIGNDVVRYQSGSSLSQIIWQKVTNGSQQLMTNNFSSITVSIDSAAGDLYTTQGVRLGSSAFGLINNGGQDLSVKGVDIFGAEYFNLRMYGGTNVGDYKFKTNTNTGAVFFTTSRFDGSNPFVITDAARVGIGTNSPQSRLDVRAQGGLSTDIAFRVRNSANTKNLANITGLGDVYLGDGVTVTNQGTEPLIGIGKSVTLNGVFNSSPIGIGTNVTANGSSIAIGKGSSAGDSGVDASIAIGFNAIATGGSAAGSPAIAIGSNVTASSQNTHSIIIGHSLAMGGATSANVVYGRFMNGASFIGNAFAFGSGVSSASRATLDIGDSFSVYINQNTRALFLNQKSNLVFRNGQSLTSGTDFDASATNTITIHNGVAPTVTLANGGQLYVESGALKYRGTSGTVSVIAPA